MTPKTVLLVDDDADFLQAIAVRCRSIGFEVERARNLWTAMAMIEKRVPDVICVDVQLPTGNGLKFCETLAGDPRTEKVPIIVLSGHSQAEIQETCRRLRVSYLQKKPDVWEALQPLLQQLPSAESTPPMRPVRGAKSKPRPANIPALPDVELPGDGEPAAKKSTKQIVIADDDADLVQLLSQRCSSLGCSVIGVGTAVEAINVINRMMPDLVFLDVCMPSGNGLGVCEMITSDDRLRSIPIIVLTGRSDEETIRRCHDMLVFYVQKGADIWSRVEPLVRELLQLGDAPLPETATAEVSAPPKIEIDEAPTLCEQPRNTSQDGLLDAVFAMLGSGEPLMIQAPAEDSANGKLKEAEEIPWILCIDDDADYSDALKIRFEDHGVAVARAFSGMEGFRMAFSSPASAILLDYHMPNGEGDYVLGRLKDNPATRDIPVFMITGVKDKMLERRVYALGAAGFFNKPIDFEELRRELSQYIDILAKPALRAVALAR